MKNFLKFSAGFFMPFPARFPFFPSPKERQRPWHYHEYLPSPPFSAFDTFPFADLKLLAAPFRFSSSSFFFVPRFSVFRSLRSGWLSFFFRFFMEGFWKGASSNYVFMLGCAVSNICSSILYGFWPVIIKWGLQ